MDRSQMTGGVLMGLAAVQFLVFLVGVARKSYAAIALPVTAAMAALSALTFWVGWTMLTTETDVPEPELDEAAPEAQ